MSEWYLVKQKSPLSAAENMARDEFFFNECHRLKVGFFRLYTWENPTFSYGFSQKVQKVLNLDYIKGKGYSYVRRITGGKVVLHDDEVTYSVISSEDIFFKENDLYQSYLLIAKILVNAFQRLGLEAVLSSGSSSKLSRSNNPCFSFPTPNEIEISGKKIVGSAQKRDNVALLQHGSIPISMNFDTYAKGTGVPAELIKNSMTTLKMVTGKTREDLIQALVDSFQSFAGSQFKQFTYGKEHQEAIGRLVKKYSSIEWLERPDKPLQRIAG